MIKELHRRSVHIDAPVAQVFDYVKEPRHWLEAFPEQDRQHMALAEVNLTPDGGVGSTYRLMGRMFLLFHMEWTLTREEYVPDKHFVDHANTGGAWIFDFEPDETGTTVSAAFGWSSRIPFMADLVDRGWNGDSDLDAMLANLKRAIEA